MDKTDGMTRKSCLFPPFVFATPVPVSRNTVPDSTVFRLGPEMTESVLICAGIPLR